MRQLVALDGASMDPTTEAIAAALQKETGGFWLDIENPDDSDFELADKTFHFHPLTLEDVRHRKQRPKLEEYEGYDFLVLFTAEQVDDDIEIREHHIYLSSRYVVTIHLEPSPSLARIRERLTSTPELTRRGLPFLFYLVADQLVDANFPVLDALDDETDRLEDSVLSNPDPSSLARIQRLKHTVVDLRKVLGAQRDVFRSLTTHSISGNGEAINAYFRDLYDHIVRQYETADSLRDLLSSAMDVYLSTVSNRMNDIMKRLTVIATLFMPLTFITGFFGMNFGAMVNNITTPGWLMAGMVVMAATVVLQFAYFRRRGWT